YEGPTSARAPFSPCLTPWPRSPRRGPVVKGGWIARFRPLGPLLRCLRTQRDGSSPLGTPETRGKDMARPQPPPRTLARSPASGAPSTSAVQQAVVRLVEEVLAQPPARVASSQWPGPLLDASVQ